MKAEDINWEEAPEYAEYYLGGLWYKIGLCNTVYFYDDFDKWSISVCNVDTIKRKASKRPKEKEMQFKPMKIRVKDEEHSRLIQEALFEMGYGWVSTHKEYEHMSARYIYTSKGGMITYSMSDYSFIQDPHKEYEAKIKVEFVEVQKPDTVELNGKTYLKSDLEEALAKLNPVGLSN